LSGSCVAEQALDMCIAQAGWWAKVGQLEVHGDYLNSQGEYGLS